MEDINDIRAEETYLLVYIRHKTDEEIKIEKEVSNLKGLAPPLKCFLVLIFFINYFSMLTKFLRHKIDTC